MESTVCLAPAARGDTWAGKQQRHPSCLQCPPTHCRTTWELEDWSWDPFNLFAAPKATPHVQCCQAFKRRKGPEGAASNISRETDAACHMPATSTGCCSMPLPSTQLKRSLEAASSAAPSYDLEQKALANNNNNNAWPLPSHAARLVDEHALHTQFLPQPLHTAGQEQVNQSVWNAQQGIAAQQFQEMAYQQLLALQGGQPVINGASKHPAGLMPLPSRMSPPLPSQMKASSPVMSSADTVCNLPCDVKPPATHTKASKAKGAKQQQVQHDSDGEPLGFDSDSDHHHRSSSGNLDVDVVSVHDPADDGRMVCQVPGCGKDLTNLKEYHLRYRICEVHIRLSQVGLAGLVAGLGWGGAKKMCLGEMGLPLGLASGSVGVPIPPGPRVQK